MIDLWMHIDALKDVYYESNPTSFKLGDFTYVIQHMSKLCREYYRNIPYLEKYINPKDLKLLQILVHQFEVVQRWVNTISTLNFDNYSRMISSIPIGIICELHYNLKDDTMLRVVKNVKFDEFTPKVRKYQCLFRKLREHNELNLYIKS